MVLKNGHKWCWKWVSVSMSGVEKWVQVVLEMGFQ